MAFWIWRSLYKEGLLSDCLSKLWRTPIISCTIRYQWHYWSWTSRSRISSHTPLCISSPQPLECSIFPPTLASYATSLPNSPSSWSWSSGWLRSIARSLAFSAQVAAWGCSIQHRCRWEIDRLGFTFLPIIAWPWIGDSWDACFVGGDHCNLVGVWRILRSFHHRSAPTIFLCPAKLEATLGSSLSKPPCFPRPSSTSARRNESTAECAWLPHLLSYSSGLWSLPKRLAYCWWVYHSTFYSTCWDPK